MTMQFSKAQANHSEVTAVLFPMNLWCSILRYEVACASCSPELIRVALDDLAVHAVHARRDEQGRIDALTRAKGSP